MEHQLASKEDELTVQLPTRPGGDYTESVAAGEVQRALTLALVLGIMPAVGEQVPGWSGGPDFAGAVEGATDRTARGQSREPSNPAALRMVRTHGRRVR